MELSETARIVAGSVFGHSPDTTLRYQMIESVPSPEMQTALDELVAAGAVNRDDELSGAVRYTACRSFDFSEFRKEAYQRILAGTAPFVRIYIKKV